MVEEIINDPEEIDQKINILCFQDKIKIYNFKEVIKELRDKYEQIIVHYPSVLQYLILFWEIAQDI